MLGSMWGLDSQPSKPDEVSLKARKRLCLPGLKKNESLNLKKATIQTIIKKQRHYSTSKTLLNQKDILKHGLFGRKVEIKPAFWSLSIHVYLSRFVQERYRQMLLQCKNVQALGSEAVNLSLPLVRRIETLRALQQLKLTLSEAGFIKLPKILQSLSYLRGLSLALRPNSLEVQTEKVIETAVLQFSQVLQTRKFLNRLRIEIQKEHFFGTNQSGAHLFNTVGSLNLSFFGLYLPVSDKIVSALDQSQVFLEKVEHLWFKEQHFIFGPPSAFNKVLVLVGKPTLNLYEIVTQCSSLKKLDFNFPPHLDPTQIPASLGKAKGIRDLRIDYPHNRDPLISHKLNHLIAEASELDSFFISLHYLEEEMKVIHETLRNSKLQNYCLYHFVSKNTVKTDTLSFKDFCQKIGNIHSLKDLKLICEYIEDGKSFESILTNLTNLKSLLIRVSKADDNVVDFPWECLGSLQLLEELMIELPSTKKADILSRLPRMTSLKRLKIWGILDLPGSEVEMLDYNKKFSS